MYNRVEEEDNNNNAVTAMQVRPKPHVYLLPWVYNRVEEEDNAITASKTTYIHIPFTLGI